MNASSERLHPDFPIVYGEYGLTKTWKLNLPIKLNRRVEEGSLVLWRPGFTIWIEAWNNDNNESIESRLTWIEQSASPESFELIESRKGNVVYFSYRLNEDSDDERVAALYGTVISDTGHLNVVCYFDEETDSQMALEIFKSVVYENSA